MLLLGLSDGVVLLATYLHYSTTLIIQPNNKLHLP